MAPIAPAPERRPLLSRKLVMLGVVGACCGATVGAFALALMLRGDQVEAADVKLGTIAPPAERASDEGAARRVLKAVAEEAPAHVGRALVRSEGAPAPEAAPVPLAEAADAQPTAAANEEPKADAEAPAAAAAAAEADSRSSAREQNERNARSDRRARRGSQRKTAALVDKPSRAQVLSAMSRVYPRVKACLGGAHGVVTADITVLGRTGRITTAQVTGQSGPIGSCVARAVRKARFPKFAAESISIRYPMKF